MHTLVTEVWKDLVHLDERDVHQRLENKLKSLKALIKAWEKEYKIKHEEKLVCLEGLLKELFLDVALETTNSDRETQIKLLEAERDTILREEEEKWRLRSRAVWLKSGDKNTKFFHNYAIFRRNKNHIWEIRVERLIPVRKLSKKKLSSFLKTFMRNQIRWL